MITKFIKKAVEQQKAKKRAQEIFKANPTNIYAYSVAILCFNKRVKQLTKGKIIEDIWILNPDKEDVYLYNTFFHCLNLRKNPMSLIKAQESQGKDITEIKEAICYAYRRICEILNIDIAKDWTPENTPNELTRIGSYLILDTLREAKLI